MIWDLEDKSKKQLEKMLLDVDVLLDVMHFDGTIVPSEVNVEKALAKEIDPNIITSLKSLGLTVAMQGSIFKRQMGFLPELLKKFYAERKYYKGLMIDAQKELAVVNTEIKLRGM